MWEAIRALFLGQAYLGSLRTPEGGYGSYLTNKTGAPSVQGTVVLASPNHDFAFEVSGADAVSVIGVVYQNGIADGAECLVITGGIVDVLLEAATSSVHGNWVRTSIGGAGGANATLGSPAASPQHFNEMGHSLQTTGPGGLCRMILHFL